MGGNCNTENVFCAFLRIGPWKFANSFTFPTERLYNHQSVCFNQINIYSESKKNNNLKLERLDISHSLCSLCKVFHASTRTLCSKQSYFMPRFQVAQRSIPDKFLSAMQPVSFHWPFKNKNKNEPLPVCRPKH